MSHGFPLRSTRNGKHSATTPSPLRHASTISNSSSENSRHSDPFLPSRTSTLSSDASTAYFNTTPGHKRGISETSPTRPSATSDYTYLSSDRSTPRQPKAERQSLRTLPQAPNVMLTPTEKMSSSAHVRDHSSTNSTLNRYDGAIYSSPEPQLQPQYSIALSRSNSRREPQREHGSRAARSGQLSPHTNLLDNSDFVKLERSSTSHLRALSKYAERGADGEFTLSSPEQEVAGLHGRRRLQRNMSTQGKRQMTAPGYGGRTWMDQQRQFLQAYEYLCHIGEAKEWIEDIIHKPIPPIVQLEEALRDGVTLAEIVQTLYPEKLLRIFRHPKLQFRHSDNIARFFNFLADVELPELFRFELVDLYEKKNVPKVIYCIHALSWLLFRKGIADFRIGNLVGQLEFEHHELEATQKGLDKAGVSMPNFAGMGAKFGAAPEPEPVETEEDQRRRLLLLSESAIQDLQAQIRGAMQRLKLGETMQNLWQTEDWLVDIQSRIRADFARQISDYRIQMKRFAVGLQSQSRGYLVRSRLKGRHRAWKDRERDVVVLQSLVRARQAKKEAQAIRTQALRHALPISQFQAAIRGAMKRSDLFTEQERIVSVEGSIVGMQTRIRGALQRIHHAAHHIATKHAESGIRQLQAAIRAAQSRRRLGGQCEEAQDASSEVELLQAAARGMLQRRRVRHNTSLLRRGEPNVIALQARIRGSRTRQQRKQIIQALLTSSSPWITLQSVQRAICVRNHVAHTRQQLEAHKSNTIRLQAVARAQHTRASKTTLEAKLATHCCDFTHLQSFVRGIVLRRSFQSAVKAVHDEKRQIISLQGLARSSALRQTVYHTVYDLSDHEAAIVNLQSQTRGMLVRADITVQLQRLEVEEELVEELQSAARALLVRKAYIKKQQFFNENMKKVIKIQSFVRARQQGEAYKSLTSGKNPPVGTVKNFVHLLNDSDFDFDEELESEKLRKMIVQRVQANEQTEEYITELDAKIGMLAKTKITTDDAASNRATLVNRRGIARDTLNLKSLNKSSRAKLELYQELFFILQTQPQYLARLFKKTREQGAASEEYRQLEALVMRVFLFAQNHREEFFLLKLIAMSIKQEVDGCASLHEFLRSKFFYSRLFTSYTRIPRDRKVIPDALGPMIKANILENNGLDLESDPLLIYRAVVHDEELRTGQRSQRNLDVPRDLTMKDPQVRSAFIKHLSDLRDICDAFWECLEKVLLPKMPYGTRYVARRMFEILCEKYPRENAEHMLQIVGSWIWKTYFKPAFAEPETLGIVGPGLDFNQRRNLAAVVKVVDQATAGSLFGADNMYMQPLNNYVEETIGFLNHTWKKLIQVPDPEVHFDIDQFNDLYAKQKPTLFISVADIFAVHQLVTSNLSYMCVSHEDSILRDVIQELGSAKSNEAEMSAGSADVTLSLSTKLHVVEDPDADIKALFMETKRCVLYIIRIQAGANLMDIMVKPITPEDEDRWEALLHEELTLGSRKRSAYSDANNLIDIASMSYAELKRTALENILVLEQHGRLTRHNHYQDVLNEIAVDIRQKHKRRLQRQKQLESIRSTIVNLDEKQKWLDDVLKKYNDTYEQNLTVLQNNKEKKKKVTWNPFTKQANHERELARAGKTPRYGSFKYSGEALAEKGILVEWKGRNLRDDDIAISSDEINKYVIEGSSGAMMVPGASAEFSWDDLTAATYLGQNHVRFFGTDGAGVGTLVLDVVGLMQWIGKKFL